MSYQELASVKKLILLLILAIYSQSSYAMFDKDLNAKVFGWMRAEYGNGSRYGKSQGYDRVGLKQFAIGVKADFKDN